MQVKIASSLDKVFPKISPRNIIANASILRNERFNFQICLYNDSDLTQKEVKIKPIGQIARNCEMRVVENVPAQLTEYITKDDYYIFDENADRVYPDLLRPFEYGDLILPAKQWRSVWCTIRDKKGLKAGEHTLRFAVSAPEQEDIQVELKLDVVDELLPENDLLYTNWFHYDSIANFYGVKPWSKRYYKLLSSYVDTATLHGMNLMYTPIFTPPLDTKGGWERLDVQLVKVSVDDNENYEFDFSRLDYFLDFCSSRGIKYFEMSHLATQWGAEACPKIMAHTPSGYRRIFGWDTPSFGDRYKAFIARFLPELDAFLKQKGIADRVFFHIS
ncbi:MAG: hypothetical protein E7381_04385, partial [Clostridiales bacterium]|nr:hypothetical protein [Clostridiales bacterium]